MANANADAASGTSVLKAIVLATLVAGTLDISYAIISSALLRGIASMVILQSVAGGLLGKASFEGGVATAALGAFLHYGIMACAVVVFWLASRRWPQLVQRPFLWGPVFGAGVFVVMNYVVVPLSAIGHTIQRTPPRFAAEFCVHLFFVGLPIAWFLSRASRRS